MCIAMMKAERLIYEQTQGTGMNVPLFECSDPIEELNANSGPRKIHPGSPACRFKGKVVPFVVTCSPGGGFNQMILMECLKKMDELQAFDRAVAKPRALLDEHGSRLSLDFLSRVSDNVSR